MKKPITALTVMTLTLQANDEINQQLEKTEQINGVPINTITFNKSVMLSDDADGSGNITEGDILSYQFLINNSNTIEASGSFISDEIDSDTSLIVGSVSTNSGIVVSGNSTGDQNVFIDVGTISDGNTVMAGFDVIVNEVQAGQQAAIINQATLSTTNLGSYRSDDDRFSGQQDPTIVHANGPPLVIPSNNKVGLMALILAMLSSVLWFFRRNKTKK